MYFAGHPLLGAAAVIHSLDKKETAKDVNLFVKDRNINLTSKIVGDYYDVTMNQGISKTIYTLSKDEYKSIHAWFSMTEDQIDQDYPLSVLSTGLPYLLIPVKKNLEKIKICINDLEKRLMKFGAKFVYFFDTQTLECRTWDNTGIYEDVATGSAAGPLIAYLVNNNIYKKKQKIIVHQGKYLGRNSEIEGYMDDNNEVKIIGSVSMFSEGKIFI